MHTSILCWRSPCIPVLWWTNKPRKTPQELVFIHDGSYACISRCSINIMSFTILLYSFDKVQVFTLRQLILKFLSRNSLHFTQLFLWFYKQLKADNRSNRVVLNMRSALHALQEIRSWSSIYLLYYIFFYNNSWAFLTENDYCKD